MHLQLHKWQLVVDICVPHFIWTLVHVGGEPQLCPCHYAYTMVHILNCRKRRKNLCHKYHFIQKLSSFMLCFIWFGSLLNVMLCYVNYDYITNLYFSYINNVIIRIFHCIVKSISFSFSKNVTILLDIADGPAWVGLYQAQPTSTHTTIYTTSVGQRKIISSSVGVVTGPSVNKWK